jgi:heme/copper-type cytochrome/quinol oxidase subunit 3
MQIPYVVDARPDTGLYNARLGMWLFLASEVMLFGGFFSAYVLLRTGTPNWPSHELNVPMAALNTAVLIASSMTMVMAWASLKMQQWGKGRGYLAATFLLGAVFLAMKGVEYAQHFAAGETPAFNMFFATYYTLTGMHALHVVGGMLIIAWFLGPGWRMVQQAPGQLTNRIEVTGLYWHFVDLVWIFLFPILYLV